MSKLTQFTRIKNDIIMALVSIKLSGQELQAILFVLRKTYGYRKIEDYISLSQFAKAMNISKIRAQQIVANLALRKILTVKESINGITRKLLFNRHFGEWETTVKENINRKGFTKETVKVLRKRPLRKTLTTKETIQKKVLQKKTTTIPAEPSGMPVKPYILKTDTQSKVVYKFKEKQGIDVSDRDWDKLNWARYAKSAKKLVAYIKIEEDIFKCIDDLIFYFEDNNLTWTIETILKWADKWKSGKLNEDEYDDTPKYEN